MSKYWYSSNNNDNKIQKIKRSGLCNFQFDKTERKNGSKCFFFQTVITIIGFLLNDNNKQEIAQKTQTNVTTHTFL